jgi:hypothetical protein
MRENPYDQSRAQDEGIQIVVENHGFSDVTVYVLREGVPFRLGIVPGMGTGRFPASQTMIGMSGSYQLMADYVGARRTTTTDLISPIAGSTTLWRLEQSDWQSTVVIR